jgi:hypothetical protein
MGESNALVGGQDKSILGENVKGGGHAGMIMLAGPVVEPPNGSKLSDRGWRDVT